MNNVNYRSLIDRNLLENEENQDILKTYGN
jgi:hypothetical protein